ncbi:MAG: phosphoribosylformylglycinamidine synthase subunit PurL, partial [Atribacterota bacterium]
GGPSVAGELIFHPSFQGNCLVNVMCLGVAPAHQLAKAWAKGMGNPIIYAGNRTGRDGIGGCSILASQEFGANDAKRPSVQIGDPFTEKCLIEATLEALTTGHVVGIKDMGAAGLTCSSSEMAAAGNTGVRIDLDQIPVREEAMEPWEIMMSESQERMLLCIEKGFENDIMALFKKWGLEAVVVGKAVEGQNITILSQGQVIADIPAQELAKPPIYTPPAEPPEYLPAVNVASWIPLPVPADLPEVFLRMISSPNLCSREQIYEQYDHMVQINTSILPGTGTVMLRMKEKPWGIAVTTDCNPTFCYLDPYRGAQMAVAEAARNIAACGARPAGITDCLNFGNPQKPDRYWQFVETVKGLSDACQFFELPVVSGNVSFYNESPNGSIHPTPTIGMVGIIENVENAVSASFKKEDDIILLFGETREELGGSEYLRIIHNMEQGPAPRIDLAEEKNLQDLLINLASQKLVHSASDLSEGGLVQALTEACVGGTSSLGCRIDIEGYREFRLDAVLFGESCGRAIISASPDLVPAIVSLARTHQVPYSILGSTGGDRFLIQKGPETVISLPITQVGEAWKGKL